MKVILASQSPRRRELLAHLGMEFDIEPAQGEEIITKTEPAEVVMELARGKAREISGNHSGEDELLIIGADTVVVKDNKILGKPADREEAVSMLCRLRGDVHQVYTGVCLILCRGGQVQEHSFYEATDVEFYPMTDEEVASYADSGDCMDKAGAYGIQSGCAIYIRGIRGDYNNVVGLPVARLYQELKHLL